MTTKNKTNIYKLKGNPIIKDVPIIGNLLYDEIGKVAYEAGKGLGEGKC